MKKYLPAVMIGVCLLLPRLAPAETPDEVGWTKPQAMKLIGARVTAIKGLTKRNEKVGRAVKIGAVGTVNNIRSNDDGDYFLDVVWDESPDAFTTIGRDQFESSIKIISLAEVKAPLTKRSALMDIKMYPVERGRLIIDKRCERDAELDWDPAFLGGADLKRGMIVWGVTPAELIPASLGDVGCFVGDCKGNYVSIELEGPHTDKFLAALEFDETLNIESVPVAIAPSSGVVCESLLSSISTGSLRELSSLRACKVVSVSNQTVLTLAVKGFKQENGPVLYSEAAAAIGSTETVRLSDGTSQFLPIVALRDESDSVGFLWRKSSGMCCPSEVTLQLSRIDGAGNLVFGPAFKAGGQPCD